MIYICLRSTILAIISCFSFISSFEVIPEHANVTYINEKYVTDVKFFIKRYGRRSPYYLNLEGIVKHVWVNNVSTNFLFFEYLHNEYRRSFVELHYKVCDLIDKEPYIGGIIKSRGVSCPILPKEYHVLNMTFPTENFPNVFPFQKGRVEIEVYITETGETIGKGFLNAMFKDLRKPPKLSKTRLLGSEQDYKLIGL